MKFSTSSAGYDISFDAPSTVQEYDAASESGQCLQDALSDTVNRATVLQWQSEFAKVLAERTGIQRQIDAEATAKVKSRAKKPDEARVVMERFTNYNKRVNAQYASANGKRAELESWAQEVADKISVDPSRQRGNSPSKADIAKAEEILSGTPESIEARVEKYLTEVSFDLVRDDSGLPEKQSLARLVSKYIAAVV